jgi:hypothetical protein
VEPNFSERSEPEPEKLVPAPQHCGSGLIFCNENGVLYCSVSAIVVGGIPETAGRCKVNQIYFIFA